MKKLFWILTILCLGISCEKNVTSDDENETITEENDYDSEYNEDSVDTEWDSLNTRTITLNYDDVEIIGEGAEFIDNQILIEDGGSYFITGTLTDGQIVVQADSLDTVKIILDNVDISCSDNPAILITKSNHTVILLEDNSKNTVSDGSSYDTEEVNAAIFSKSDLIFSGTGKLTVNGNNCDGITSKDGLIFYDGEYDITAVDDGIRGKDYLIIKGGSYTIASGGDGIKSDNENSGCGYIKVIYGEFDITAAGDGLQAEYEIYIEDGIFDIYCSSSQSSGKTIKAGTEIDISGGTFNLEGKDDAVHSDEDIILTGGTFTIDSNDDAFHAENTLEIDYADIDISDSYEGLEAKIINIAGGNIYITSSDDGLNASSGSGSSYMSANTESGSNDVTINITGGTLVVDANGDGIDSNGSITMSGGSVVVNGPTSNSNGAIDYDNNFTISGGLLVAAGSSGMTESISSSSSQCSLLIIFSSTQSANTIFNLQDEEGNEIVTYKSEKQFQAINISSPDLTTGTTYNIYTGGSHSGTLVNDIYEDGEYTAGTLYTSFTISSTTTTIGSSGGGGNNNPGGGSGGHGRH